MQINSTKLKYSGASDSTTKFLEKEYPVGSIYITTASSCPLAELFGTWQSIGSSIVTSVDSTASVRGNGKTLGLTNGTTTAGAVAWNSGYGNRLSTSTNALNISTDTTSYNNTNNIAGSIGVTPTASNSGLTATVTRNSISVNLFKRTA